jgi:hypothetical protein
MHRILYRLIAAVARLAVRSGRSKDLEIIALRHQLGVLRRKDPPASPQRQRPIAAQRGRAVAEAGDGSLSDQSSQPPYSGTHLTSSSTEIGSGTRISDRGRFDKGS